MAWKNGDSVDLATRVSSEWKKDNRNELKVSSNVTTAHKAHSESRTEWQSANAGDDGDMCEVMTGCG